MRTATEDQTLALAIEVDALSDKTPGNPKGWVGLATLDDHGLCDFDVIEQAHRDGLISYSHGPVSVVRPA